MTYTFFDDLADHKKRHSQNLYKTSSVYVSRVDLIYQILESDRDSAAQNPLLQIQPETAFFGINAGWEIK